MNNKINKQIIIVDDFSHTNTNKIELIHSNCDDIKDELINKNYNDDFIMTIVNSIFCQLDIDDFLINNDNSKKTMKNTIIAMNRNFFINKKDKNGKIIKQNKNFILAEFSIPLFLKKNLIINTNEFIVINLLTMILIHQNQQQVWIAQFLIIIKLFILKLNLLYQNKVIKKIYVKQLNLFLVVPKMKKS